MLVMAYNVYKTVIGEKAVNPVIPKDLAQQPMSSVVAAKA
jgi:hypothetical protein